MKALLLTLSLVALFISAGTAQTIRVVDNNPNAPTGSNVYKTLQEAIDAASPGDIIHVMPSATAYGGATIKKKLSIYGIGFNPAKEGANKSTVNGLGFEGPLDPSGTVLSGLVLNGLSLASRLPTITSLIVTKCLISGGAGGTAIGSDGNTNLKDSRISNCIFLYGRVFLSGRYTNLLFANNILLGASSSISGDYSTQLSNTIFANNIFFGDNPAVSGAFWSIGGFTATNNIFYIGKPAGAVLNAQFNNNITYLTREDQLPPAGEGNSGSKNLIGKDPMFEKVPLEGANAYSPTFDFRLKAGSPGKNAGTDGTDIGIYGGAYPFDPSGVPALPLIQQFNAATVIKAGTDLSVTIRAKAN